MFVMCLQTLSSPSSLPPPEPPAAPPDWALDCCCWAGGSLLDCSWDFCWSSSAPDFLFLREYLK